MAKYLHLIALTSDFVTIKGKFTWVDGTIYQGDFNYNVIEGTGK